MVIKKENKKKTSITMMERLKGKKIGRKILLGGIIFYGIICMGKELNNSSQCALEEIIRIGEKGIAQANVLYQQGETDEMKKIAKKYLDKVNSFAINNDIYFGCAPSNLLEKYEFLKDSLRRLAGR